MLPPGCARLATKPLPTGLAACKNTIGVARLFSRKAAVDGVPSATTTSGIKPISSFARARIWLISPELQRKSITTLRSSDHPSLSKRLSERCKASGGFRIVLRNIYQDADPSHALSLLRARRERPRRRTAEQRDELAPS